MRQDRRVGEVRGVLSSVLILAAVIDLDVTYFFQLGLFLSFLLAMSLLVFKPMLALFERRKSRTEGKEKETTRMNREADELQAKYDLEINQAMGQGIMERNRLRDEALREEADRLTAARAAANASLEAEIAKAAAQLEAARGESQAAAESLGKEIADILSGG
jgi:F0F1-type ATP synthase membrane subunit b/b'